MGSSMPFQIQKDSGIPLYIQLEGQVRLLLQQGDLQPGDMMPTVRALAVELGINSNTVARVYRDLQQAGVLVLRRGVGTFVSEDLTAKALHRKELEELDRKVDELITLCRRLQIAPRILSQFIESRWTGGAS